MKRISVDPNRLRLFQFPMVQFSGFGSSESKGARSDCLHCALTCDFNARSEALVLPRSIGSASRAPLHCATSGARITDTSLTDSSGRFRCCP